MGLHFISGYLWTPHARQRLLFVHSFIYMEILLKSEVFYRTLWLKIKKVLDKWEQDSVEVALPLSWLSPTRHTCLKSLTHGIGAMLTWPAWVALELPLMSTHPWQINLSPSAPASHVYDFMPDSHCFFTFSLFFPLNLIIKDASWKLSSKPFVLFISVFSTICPVSNRAFTSLDDWKISLFFSSLF